MRIKAMGFALVIMIVVNIFFCLAFAQTNKSRSEPDADTTDIADAEMDTIIYDESWLEDQLKRTDESQVLNDIILTMELVSSFQYAITEYQDDSIVDLDAVEYLLKFSRESIPSPVQQNDGEWRIDLSNESYLILYVNDKTVEKIAFCLNNIENRFGKEIMVEYALAQN